ncbi:MAG: hypothetical protein WBV89_13340, partial [Ilumatobacter sp.]
MTSSASTTRQGDGRLWAIALLWSLLINVVFLGILGFSMVKSHIFRPPMQPTPQAAETTVTIFPEMIQATPADAAEAPAGPASREPRFARTSEDQESPAPDAARFIGERDTQATSDRTPQSAAPDLPSQSGIEHLNNEHLETTESDYRDGSLAGSTTARPTPAPEPPVPQT